MGEKKWSELERKGGGSENKRMMWKKEEGMKTTEINLLR